MSDLKTYLALKAEYERLMALGEIYDAEEVLAQMKQMEEAASAPDVQERHEVVISPLRVGPVKED